MNANWEEILKNRLELYGHRNWLVVADSAHPAKSKPGIETIVADADRTTVLERVKTILGACKHVMPTDRKLTFSAKKLRRESLPTGKNSAIYSMVMRRTRLLTSQLLASSTRSLRNFTCP
jgi:hypothetical protein